MNVIRETVKFATPPLELVQKEVAEQIELILETAFYNAAVEIGPYALKELIYQVDSYIQSLESNVSKQYASLVHDMISNKIKEKISAKLLDIANILMQDNGIIGDMSLKVSSYACHRFALQNKIHEKVSSLLSDFLIPAGGKSSSQKPNSTQKIAASITAQAIVNVFAANLDSFGNSYQIKDITQERKGCGIMMYRGADVVMNCVSSFFDT